ncbi:MAG: hypothetical protein ACKVP4_11105, partial [Hyphomicrobium sp.]
MADKTGKSSSEPPAPDQGGGKRPHATLDLKATEIKETPISQSASAAASATASVASKGADTKTPGPAPAASYSENSKDKAASAAKVYGADTTAQLSAMAGPAPATASKRGGMFSHLAAGLVGGVLALTGLQWAVPLLHKDDPASRLADVTTSLTQRLAALEKKSPDLTAVATEVDQRIATVEKSVSEIPELRQAHARLVAETKAALAAAASDAGEPEQLTRLNALEGKFKALVDAGANDPDAGRLPQLAALTGKVADLETSLSTQLTELRKSVAQDVDGRILAATEA